MLFLSITLGGMLFALPSRDVNRVLPLIPLRTVPNSPPFFAGLFEYESKLLPVVDLQVLTHQQPCARRFSTRILLATLTLEDIGECRFGLLAERVTDAFNYELADARTTGVATRGAEFLGGVIETGGRSFQVVHLERILSKPMKEVLARDYQTG